MSSVSTSVAARKGRVTRQANALSSLLEEYRKYGDDAITTAQPDLNQFLLESESAQVHIRTMQDSLDRAIDTLARTIDYLDKPMKDDEHEQVSNQIEHANALLSESDALLARIEVQKQKATMRNGMFTEQQGYFGKAVSTPVTAVARIDLPPLPIPEFSGESWQWDNFWELFNATVHSSNISNLQKFNYLLQALKGEAKETAKGYQVTSSNYPLVLEHLQRKYGTTSTIVTTLHSRLETWTARSVELKDQRKLLDQLSSITTQLQSKGENLDSHWLLSKILAKFREDIQRRVLEKKVSLPSGQSWDLNQLMNTLDTVLRQEEEIARHLPAKMEPKGHQIQERQRNLTEKKFPLCLYCESAEHRSTACTKLQLPKDRMQYLKDNKRCLNCGSDNHSFQECKSKGCYNCGRKHHTSTCYNRTFTKSSTSHTEQKKGDKTKKTTQNFASTNESSYNTQENMTDHVIVALSETTATQKVEEVFMLTGALNVKHPLTNDIQKIEILLDSGADRSFIDSKLAQELCLEKFGKTCMKLTTFGSSDYTNIECFSTKLEVWDADGKPHILDLFTHDKLTASLNRRMLDERDLRFIRQKRVHVCTPHKENQVQPRILIGCDQLWTFIKFEAPHYTLPSGLLLIPTQFGYMISGKKSVLDPKIPGQFPASVHSIQIEDNNDHWEQHWSNEPQKHVQEYTGPEKEEKARINAEVLREFNDSIQRRNDGYYVRLPLKKQHDDLPDNRALALKRLRCTLQSYGGRQDLLEQYDQVFKDQLQKGVLEEVNENNDLFVTKKHYLSHLPVINPQKDSTKFRVVFDASAHYKHCPSLNDVVHQGPTILPKLYGILLRFRTGKYVLLSDVEKAFLQVRLHEDDRNLTRCLWIKDIKKPLTVENLAVYRFTRVTFGINASPFLLSATILFHLKNFVHQQELAEEIALNLYVDNLLVCAQSEDEVIQKYKSLKTIFADLQMNLRQFIANSEAIMESISPQDRLSNRNPKVLGLPWNSLRDEFVLNVTMKEKTFVSKRVVAQQLASIYDPLGWCIPLLVQAKHFQQQLWKKHYDWDEPLNQRDKEKWKELTESMNPFQKNIPRMVSNPDRTYTLITYTDASMIAMAACTYLVDEEHSNLLMAKSKVTDGKKEFTIPKLELNAIAMGARLSFNVFQSLKSVLQIDHLTILSDSEIALKWILSTNGRSNGAFVTNRAKEVRKIAQDLESSGVTVRFGYIESTRNPADSGTRGLHCEEFETHRWWKGYTLKELEIGQVAKNLSALPENDGDGQLLETHMHTTETTNNCEVSEIVNLEKFSSLTKIRRVMAYALKFLKHLISRTSEELQLKLYNNHPWLKHQSQEKYLTATDIRDADYVLLLNHQRIHIRDQFKKELNKNLNLKEDDTGLQRAYGRLNTSDLSASAKNPILIVQNTRLSYLVIAEAHGQYHRATAHTMSEVRQKYWIPRLREQVKKFIRQCIPCQKINALVYKYPEMTDLPSRRVTKSWPFQHAGLDYFGPLTVYREDKTKTNAYGCIFTCAVTRLLHLELVPDGTTEAFLNAFRRFVARRGKPQSITCDNAPVFVLGSQILSDTLEDLHQNEVLQRIVSNEGIEWHHITPYSPWKGGFYERLIKGVKNSMFKAIGKRVPTMDQLVTLLTEVEACLNTRPLTYQETDIDDNIRSLRPIDFIQKEIDITLPLEEMQSTKDDPTYLPPSELNRLNTRLQTVKALQSSCALTERYWRLWKESYLTALREQHRRNIDNKRGTKRPPNEGDVVLIADTYQKRNNWRLGRITKLIHSSDGAFREAEVMCSKSNYIRRPINQLIPLEINEDNEIRTNERQINQSETAEQHEGQEHTQAQPRYNLRTRSAPEPTPRPGERTKASPTPIPRPDERTTIVSKPTPRPNETTQIVPKPIPRPDERTKPTPKPTPQPDERSKTTPKSTPRHDEGHKALPNPTPRPDEEIKNSLQPSRRRTAHQARRTLQDNTSGSSSTNSRPGVYRRYRYYI